MKNVLITAAFFFCLSIISIKTGAQRPHLGIFIHALYAAPLDNSSRALYSGGGGAVGGILVGRKNTMFSGSIGYTRFFSDNDNNLYGDQTYIPVKAGIRQYVPLTLHFLFVQGDLGIGFVDSKNPGNDGTRFAFDVGAGVKFAAFELALVWDNFHETQPEGLSSWLNIRAGINLGF